MKDSKVYLGFSRERRPRAGSGGSGDGDCAAATSVPASAPLADCAGRRGPVPDLYPDVEAAIHLALDRLRDERGHALLEHLGHESVGRADDEGVVADGDRLPSASATSRMWAA